MLKKILNLFLSFILGIKLVKLLSHKNKIVVLENLSKGFFVKISFSKNADNLLLNESEGFKWYSKVSSENFEIKLKNKLLKILQVESFDGYSVDYHKNVLENKTEIYKVIDYYKKKWPKLKKVPAHGDFTLANFIFNSDITNIYIIDWENFKKSGEVWGYDLVYFYLSVALLPNLNRNSFSKKEKKELLKMWKYIKKSIKDNDLKKDPLNYFKNIFDKSKHWSNLSKNSPNKFFLNNYL